MDSSISVRRRGRSTSYERLLVIIFTIVAVISPLYIDRRSASELEDEEEESFNFAYLLPLLLLVVILSIFVSCYLDQNRFDPYWIHRVGGSSGGILLILTILLLVLKCKSWIYQVRVFFMWSISLVLYITLAKWFEDLFCTVTCNWSSNSNRVLLEIFEMAYFSWEGDIRCSSTFFPKVATSQVNRDSCIGTSFNISKLLYVCCIHQ